MDYTESIRRTENYIAEHLSDDLSAEKIAAEAGYSVFHYCRVFREYTGVSLMTYVRGKRLEAAVEEIRKGKPTADVALECGFETASGFSRAYERKFGTKPGRLHA